MMCKLQLYLKGQYILSKEVQISDDSDDRTTEENQTIREIEINAAAQTLRIEHMRAVIKAQYDCQIAVVFQSKMNPYEPGQDFSGG